MRQTADLYCVLGNPITHTRSPPIHPPSPQPAAVSGVRGTPIAHSRSPAIHARFAELTGERIRYERRLLPIDGFARGLRDFAAQGGRGCSVTVPFKTEALRCATACSERAQLAGAA